MKPGDRVLIYNGKVAHRVIRVHPGTTGEAFIACDPRWSHSIRRAPPSATDCKRCARSKA